MELGDFIGEVMRQVVTGATKAGVQIPEEIELEILLTPTGEVANIIHPSNHIVKVTLKNEWLRTHQS